MLPFEALCSALVDLNLWLVRLNEPKEPQTTLKLDAHGPAGTEQKTVIRQHFPGPRHDKSTELHTLNSGCRIQDPYVNTS